jgi:hypothetical protein
MKLIHIVLSRILSVFLLLLRMGYRYRGDIKRQGLGLQYLTRLASSDGPFGSAGTALLELSWLPLVPMQFYLFTVCFEKGFKIN